MARIVYTDGYVHGAVDQALHTALLTMQGSWNNWGAKSGRFGFDYGIGSFTNSGPTSSGGIFGLGWFDGDNSGSYTFTPGQILPGYLTDAKLNADTTYWIRAHGNNYFADHSFIDSVVGATIAVKTYAVDFVNTNAGSAAAIGPVSADLTFSNFKVNTTESTAIATVEYRIQGSGSPWTQAGTSLTGLTGYGAQSITRTATGLLPSTTYEYILHVVRTTANSNDSTSTVYTFTTVPGTPVVTTLPAAPVGSTTATLKGSVDPNTALCRVRFGYGLSDGGGVPGSWTNLTAYQSFSGDGDQAFSVIVAGLTVSTPYFFRAFIEWPSPGFGSSASGVSLGFTTAADPGTLARGARMPRMEHFRGQYGIASDFYFSVDDVDTGSNNRFKSDTIANLWTVTPSADVQISKDGGAFANLTATPTRIGTTPLYKLSLTATEMQAADIVVMIVDQTGTPVWRDLHVHIVTKDRIGQLDINASQIAGGSALKLTPGSGGRGLDSMNTAGTGAGLMRGILESHIVFTGTLASAADSTHATLPAAGSATDDAYNDHIMLIIEGLGAGQSRAISDYAGGTKTATLARAWATTPNNTSVIVILAGPDVWDLLEGAEPTVALINNDTWRKIFQFIKRRRFNKATQDSTTQTLFRDDSTTTLVTRTVSDSGSLQSQGKYV